MILRSANRHIKSWIITTHHEQSCVFVLLVSTCFFDSFTFYYLLLYIFFHLGPNFFPLLQPINRFLNPDPRRKWLKVWCFQAWDSINGFGLHWKEGGWVRESSLLLGFRTCGFFLLLLHFPLKWWVIIWGLSIIIIAASVAASTSTTPYVSETQMVCGSKSEELVNQKVGQCWSSTWPWNAK